MRVAQSSERPRTRIDSRRLAVTTLVAALAAALVNTVVYVVGSAFDAFPTDVVIQADLPMTLAPIASLTVIATLAAGVVFALLARFTSNPSRAFLVVAASVLLGMAIPPFMIAGAPVAMIVALQVVHVTTAAIVTFGLLRYAAAR